MAAIPAGEVKDPKKNLPHALLIAIGVVAFLYILVQVVCVGTFPELAQSQKPLADAGMRFMGAAGGAIISAGAIISITGNLNILVLSGSRVPFAMAEQQHVKLNTHVMAGHPVRDIVELAKELKVELLVIGATGHSALYERLIGSRADRIVQLAHCPVLVVK